jgi:two-component system LytT family sensor kinase
LKLNTDLLTLLFKRNRFLVFLIHWIAWLLLHFIIYLPSLININTIDLDSFLYAHFVIVTSNFLFFYFIAFFVISVFGSLQKKWIWLLLGSLLLAVAFTWLRFMLEAYRIGKMSSLPDRIVKAPDFRTYFEANILTSVAIVAIAFAYRLLLIRFQQEKVRAELEKQKLEAELSFLKMQVNPHFLFNALNNIYSLAVMENSKQTGASILKLSELMRYILYEKEDTESKVRLDREVHHLNSFIDLEKLRHPGINHVHFSIEGEMDGKRIAPLLLLPLVENAFKHGVLTEKQKPVTIDLKVSDHQMIFSVNNFNNADKKDTVGGIGLQNVKKRLELIYGNTYRLNITRTQDRFNVNLLLPL